MTIRIPIQEDFVLDGGTVTSAFDGRWQRDVYTIIPPAQTMFDQVRTYLLAQPSVPHSVGFQTRIFGIGLVALTMRWGSYLAALMNPEFPPHSTLPAGNRALQPSEVSYLTDDEMMRLNIEISSNIAELGNAYRANQDKFYDLLRRAYYYLPMPAKSTQRNHELDDNLLMAHMTGSVLVYLQRHAEGLAEMQSAGLLPADFQPPEHCLEEVGVEDADRIIGNFLANFAWRNTEIENYHAGTLVEGALLMPNQRRFTERDERALLRELCSNGTAVVRQITSLFDPDDHLSHPFDKYIARFPDSALALYNTHWKWFYSYPIHWSLTETSSVIQL